MLPVILKQGKGKCGWFMKKTVGKKRFRRKTEREIWKCSKGKLNIKISFSSHTAKRKHSSDDLKEIKRKDGGKSPSVYLCHEGCTQLNQINDKIRFLPKGSYYQKNYTHTIIFQFMHVIMGKREGRKIQIEIFALK